MKFKIFSFMLISCLLIGAAQKASAQGLGFYSTKRLGYRVWQERSGDIFIAGWGFVYDSCLAEDKLINYRLNMDVGLGSAVQYDPASIFSIFSGAFITMQHTVGFGLVRKKYIRFWMGPQISLGIIRNDFKYYLTPIFVGLGGAMGLNINLGKHFTISLSAAVRAVGSHRGLYYQPHKDKVFALLAQSYPCYESYFLSRNIPRSKSSGFGYGVDGEFQIAFMIRFRSDNYRGNE